MSNTPSNIKRRRQLRDLYAKGKTIRFLAEGATVHNAKGELEQVYDAEGAVVPLHVFNEAPWATDDADDVQMICTPPNPLQREEALREGQAERARMVLRIVKEKDSPEGLSAAAYVAGMSLDDIIEYLMTMQDSDYQQTAQRQVLAQEEWKDFTNLQDALRRWDEDGRPETDEWKPLLDRDVEFGTQVGAEQDRVREAANQSMRMLPRSELDKRAIDRRKDILGNQAFLVTYEREMLYFSLRDPENAREQFFENCRDMMAEDDLIHTITSQVLSSFLTDVGEAKNSSRAADSLEPSPLSEKLETSEPSGPTEPSD